MEPDELADQSPVVAIVVPVYERVREVHRFIEQCLEQTYAQFELVVVDHGRIHVDCSKYDDPRLVVLHESPVLWWTGATNRGVEYVLQRIPRSDFILIINDDVSMETSYLQSLVDAARSHPKSIVGSVSVDDVSGQVLSASFSLNRFKASFVPEYHRRALADVPDGYLPSDILPGRGMLVPTAVFDEVGLFLEKALPHYGADNEFSHRARKAGHDLIVSKRCIVRTKAVAPVVCNGGRLRLIRELLFGHKSKANLPTLFTLSRCYFHFPYDLYYFVVNATLKVLSTAKHTLLQP